MSIARSHTRKMWSHWVIQVRCESPVEVSRGDNTVFWKLVSSKQCYCSYHICFSQLLYVKNNTTLVWLIRQVRQGEACRFPTNPCLLSLCGLHNHPWWAPLLYGDNQAYAPPPHPGTESLHSWWSLKVAQTLVQASLVGERVHTWPLPQQR